jgi:HTH-type transcriptional regulator/antitoxin HigA
LVGLESERRAEWRSGWTEGSRSAKCGDLRSTRYAEEDLLQIFMSFVDNTIDMIDNEKDYDRASEVLQSLFGRKNLDADQKKYLDSLTILVEKYEIEHDAPEFDKNVSPVELLRHLMDANDMTVSELGKIVGTQALASMILSRKRRISLNNAKRLAKHFRLGVEAFV